MAIGSAMPDKGRVISAEKTSTRINGAKIVVPSTSALFRCRLTLPTGEEAEEEGRKRKVRRPTLMLKATDTRGRRVVIRGKDKIEVVSREFGTDTWEIQGDPKPIRKRRSVIGWTATLAKVST